MQALNSLIAMLSWPPTPTTPSKYCTGTSTSSRTLPSESAAWMLVWMRASRSDSSSGKSVTR